MSIKRDIYFYLISWIDSENNTIYNLDNDFFNDIFEKICTVERFDTYWKSIEKIPDSNHEDWTFGIISKIKTTDFPLKQNLTDKTLSDLKLNENEGLYYPSHFAIYNGKILMFEYNFESFRINSTLKNNINNYLKKHKVNNIKEIQIIPILQDDPKKLLNDSKVRDIQIDIAPGKSNILESSSLSGMFGNINEFPDDLILTIGVKLGKRRANKYYDKINNIKNKFSDLLSNDKINSLEKFTINVKKDDGTEIINLLDYFFKVKVELPKSNNKTRAIDSKKAFEIFTSIYSKHEDKLNNYMLTDLYDD